jgi:2,4-dienoyl-CoA reductase-like NADH-dependent reductase (Old Yellow Enzyme family)
MSILFESMNIKGIQLRNRFVRSATADRCADKFGNVSEKQIELYEELSAGGVGLIITGLSNYGQLPFWNTIANDEAIPGYKRLAFAVHEQGAKIALQIYHPGREGFRFLKDRNKLAIAPSNVDQDPLFSGQQRAMTEKEIQKTITEFGDAARRVKEAGFDAVQLHGAHAYLFSQFLSPQSNRRDDAWGGSLENRLRFHREVLNDIRVKVGEDYPVFIKLGVQDGFPGGLRFAEGKKAALLLGQWGYNALEISQGLRGKTYKETEFHIGINQPEKEAYFRNWCKKITHEVDVPTMLVGGLRSFELMEEIVRDGDADFVSLCRPFVREPGIINEWKQGRRTKSACISCNGCLEAIIKGDTLHCVQEKK